MLGQRALLLPLLLLVSAVACAGRPPTASEELEQTASPAPTASPSTSTTSEPAVNLPPSERDKHVGDAQAELELAEWTLFRSLGEPVASTPPGQSTATRGHNKVKPAAEPQPGCETACMAFGSMSRSAEYICRLAGAGDARCINARSRVSDAKSRLERKGCGCPG
ncbi:MAG: hypothetical protein U0271_30095 [Polyangiaceae bacterium]